MKHWTPILLCLLLAACTGSESKSGPAPGPQPVAAAIVIGPEPGGSANPDGGAPVNLTVTGNVTYERLMVTATGLDLSSPATEDAVNVTVEAVAHNDINSVLGSAVTDANGDYSLNFSTSVDYFVRARAESGQDRVFHSQTAPAIVHAQAGSIMNRAAGNITVNLHAEATLPHGRAGAFAALDTVRRLREAVAGSFAALGPLDLFWGVGNAGTQFLQDGGGNTITLSTGAGLDGPFGNPSIYLLGGTAADPANSDHDEFDETVIAHEWASFLQLTQSRDSNFGGPHAGEEMIFSAAYSEGVVTAMGCALIGQRVYRDTSGYTGGVSSVQFEFDCESGILPGSGVGYGNEFEVTRAVWDLLDGGSGWPADTDSDPVAISMADFFASFADLATRTAPYEIAWLPSLLQQLIDDTHLTVGDADTVMQAHGAQFPPVGGDAFPATLTVGGSSEPGNLDAFSGANPNPILGPQANGLWRIELAAPASVTIEVTNTTGGYTAAAHRLDLTLHDLQRQILAQDVGSAADKAITINLGAGTYIVRVQHVPASEAASDAVSFSIQAQ